MLCRTSWSLCWFGLQEKCYMHPLCGVQGITQGAWTSASAGWHHQLDVTFARDTNPLVEGVKPSAFTSRR